MVVLAKLAASRFNQSWHYHLANEAGRPRCGAVLNLREWHQREVPTVPTGLCGRCARLLKPKAAHQAVTLRVRASGDEAHTDQLTLPLE